ncbi:MAG: hypothetical protein ACRDIV_13895 [Ktedonobacteraceae bacterium]
MYHERSNDWGFGSAFALVVALGLLMAFLTVKATLLIVHTLLRYPKKRILWCFLAAFVASLVLGGLLGFWFKSAGFLSIGAVGFIALTLTCYIVDLRNSQTLLKEPEPMVKAVLGSSWWSDDTQQAAA